ncbi:MAG TPA: tetratricopeptide repeat protein [Chthoniobacteraceae bacterium]|nr:tetratricopeptide repeat protein [Chthoniobacteraceae bacterium]
MKFHAVTILLAGGSLLAGCAYIKHVPPGESLNEAMARKAQLVAVPAPSPALVTGTAQALPAGAQPPLPNTEKVADSFTLGNLCMQQGRYADAIAAYETTVKADPTFAQAWNNLAIAYQDLGQDDKAMAAFRKYKMVALH